VFPLAVDLHTRRFDGSYKYPSIPLTADTCEVCIRPIASHVIANTVGIDIVFPAESYVCPTT
jgi:hypothetical protein